MKGFKDSNNKFHPITDYKKGVRKSRDQSAKTQGVKIERKKRERIPKCKSSDRAYCGECCQFEDCSDECNCRCQDYTPYSTWRSDEEPPTQRKAREKKDIEDIISTETESRIENLSEDEYDDYLDDVGADSLFTNYSYSELLKNSDEIAYNTGYNDWLDGEIRDMERQIEKEAEERATEEIEENPKDFGLTEKDIENDEDVYLNKLQQRTDELDSVVSQEKEDELDNDAYDEFLDNLGDDVGVGSLNIGSPALVLKEVDPTAYRVGYSEWSDGERDRITDEVTDEIDEDESIKTGMFVEA